MLWKLTRFFLFQLPPEWAHGLGALGLRLLGLVSHGNRKKFRPNVKYQFQLAGMRLDSPLGIAAGFDKDAKLVLGLHTLGFSFVEVGSVTLKAQEGNPTPRLFRVPEARALINRMGFNSEGAEAVAERLEWLRAMQPLRFPIGVNIGKNRDTPLERAVEDYREAFNLLYPYADYMVINLSSPNTPGLTSLQEGDLLKPLLTSLSERNRKLFERYPGPERPLFLKIGPDLTTEARKIAVETAMEAGFSGIIASNTSRRRDFPGLTNADPRVLVQEGGLSGAPLRDIAQAQIHEIRALMGPKKTLISVGGLSGGDDAKERLGAGADLLQVYTEFVYAGPSFPKTVARAFYS